MVLDVPTALADATAARDAGADLVEFRIDQFFTGSTGADATIERDAVVDLVGRSPLPCIVTCRPAGDEGGGFDGDEASRISLFERLAIAAGEGEHPPRYIDIELATLERSANVRQKILLAVDHPEQLRDVRTSLIVSTHDFKGRPADLFRRLSRMRADPAGAVHKVAYMARSLRDNLDLFDILAESDRPTIALGMGRFGIMSRVLSPKFGGFITFAALRHASATAPGQPTVSDLLDLYRFRSIKPSTRVYGVIGDPVEHSLSPHVHNAGFEELGAWPDASGQGAGGVYLPLPVPSGYEHFKATLLALLDHPRLTLSGCSATIPHKENLLRLAIEQRAAAGTDSGVEGGVEWEIDELSAACGAANTLIVERSATGEVRACRVTNTDSPAAVGCLRDSLGELEGLRVGLYGAGGVARGIGAGLLAVGAKVVIAARSRAQAEGVATALRGFTPTGEIDVVEPGDLTACDAYVNCTPVGMSGGPAPEESALDVAALSQASDGAAAGIVVMDTVYNPRETPLLRQTRAAGFRTIDGLAMFTRQAELQFRAWTGRDPSPGLFDRIARGALDGPKKA